MYKYKVNYFSIGGGILFPEMKRFVPEEEPKLIDYNKELFDKLFPSINNVKKENLKLSNIGKYSISNPKATEEIIKVLKKYTKDLSKLVITDATANMGGDSIKFSQHFKNVNSVEIINLHCEILKHNLKEYKIDNVKVICSDYFDVMNNLEQDIIYFDPPWGGPDYKNFKHLKLKINNVSINKIANHLIQKTKLIAIKVPFNFDVNELTLHSKFNNIYVHKIYYNNKHKFNLIILKN